jgi:Tfp pilus assembly protein PilN
MIERIEINLLPAEYRIHTSRFYLQREILYPLIALTIVVIVMGVWTFMLDTSISSFAKKITNTEQEIARNKPILTEINKQEEQKKLVQQKIRALERIDVNREKWIRLQEVFCEKLPEVTWVDKIEERKDAENTLAVDGKTYSFSEVALYMTALTESEFVNSVDLLNIEQIGGGEKIFRFIILCKINPDARLQSITDRKK